MTVLVSALSRSRAHLSPWIPMPAGELDPDAFLDRCSSPDHAAFGIWSGQQTLLGGAELRFEAEDTADIGLWIAVEHAGQGWGTAALRALCAHAFGTLSLRRLSWRCDARHTASRRLATACGFVQEGLLREHARTPLDDAWLDLAIYSRLWHDTESANTDR